MIIYHGSPDLIELLEPRRARGCSPFQNRIAIYCTHSPHVAALYAIGKGLRENPNYHIAVFNEHLIMVGNDELREGWIYHCDVSNTDLIHGPGPDDIAIRHPIRPLRKELVKPAQYLDAIIRVRSPGQLQRQLQLLKYT